jgi:hypothetical protein
LKLAIAAAVAAFSIVSPVFAGEIWTNSGKQSLWSNSDGFTAVEADDGEGAEAALSVFTDAVVMDPNFEITGAYFNSELIAFTAPRGEAEAWGMGGGIAEIYSGDSYRDQFAASGAFAGGSSEDGGLAAFGVHSGAYTTDLSTAVGIYGYAFTTGDGAEATATGEAQSGAASVKDDYCCKG